jgi:hypothetical protein
MLRPSPCFDTEQGEDICFSDPDAEGGHRLLLLPGTVLEIKLPTETK